MTNDPQALASVFTLLDQADREGFYLWKRPDGGWTIGGHRPCDRLKFDHLCEGLKLFPETVQHVLDRGW